MNKNNIKNKKMQNLDYLKKVKNVKKYKKQGICVASLSLLSASIILATKKIKNRKSRKNKVNLFYPNNETNKDVSKYFKSTNDLEKVNILPTEKQVELFEFLKDVKELSDFITNNESKLIAINREDGYAKLLYEFGQISKFKEILEENENTSYEDVIAYFETKLMEYKSYSFLDYKTINDMIIAFLNMYIELNNYLKLLLKLKTDKSMFKIVNIKKQELANLIILMINENQNLQKSNQFLKIGTVK